MNRVRWCVFVLLASCGSSQPVHTERASSGSESAATTVTDAGAADASTADGGVARLLGPNELARADVSAVVDAGLGRFLRTVDVSPVLERGAFVGFRILRFRSEDGRYDAIELAPGDVVVRVNGSPIERPEQALAIFNGLRVVSELRVEYTRAGERREVRFAIVD